MDEPLAETEERPVTWSAIVGLAICFGLSVALLTGDWATGTVVTVTIAGVMLLVTRLFPRQLGRQPAWRYLATGLGIVILPLVLLKVGEHRTPWYDLQNGYRAGGSTPAGTSSLREVVFVARLNAILVQPYRFRRITATLTGDGLHLAHPWPMKMVYDALWLPVEIFESCEPWRKEPWFTMLGVRDTNLQIGLVDDDRRVRDWCEDAGISEGAVRDR